MALFRNDPPIGMQPGGDYAIASSPVSTITMNSVMRLVYVWMFLGLAISAFVAFFVSGQIEAAIITGTDTIWLSPVVLIGSVIGTFALVIVLGIGLSRKWLSPTMAAGLFMLYAALMGVMLSSVLLAYTDATIFKAFGSTAILFGIMSVYGYTTKSDLTSMGKYLMMGLIGIIVASLINLFLGSSGLDYIISIVGVLIFVGLTAYDTQKIKRMAEDPTIQNDGNMVLKVSIYGALNLYLDFINLFLFLLRLFGRNE